MVEEILGLVWTIIDAAIYLPLLYKFLTGDKEKRETLWYGMAVLIFCNSV